MKQLINLNVNNIDYEIAVNEQDLLVDVIRRRIGLTGTKKGCGEGSCGTCTVLIDGKRALACLTLAMSCQGKKVLTIEGMEKNGELHPIQRAFVEKGAIQCGFCTPGMVLSAKALLDENSSPSVADIKYGMSGNLCRCTGYVKIIDAVESAAKVISGATEKEQGRE